MAKVKKKNSILIAGGTGFLGYHLGCFFKKKGFAVTIISKKKPPKKRYIKNVDYKKIDLMDFKKLKKTISKNYDYVINASGYVNHALMKNGGNEVILNQLISTINLSRIFINSKIKKFIQIGSSDEYGEAKAPQEEKLREKSFSPYSYSKVAASHYIQMLHKSENFPAIVVRIFLSYGPAQDENRIIPQIIKGCLNNDSFATSKGEQLRDLIYIDDLVDAINKCLSLNKEEGNILNVGTGKPIMIKDLIKKIIQLIGTGRPIYGKYPYKKSENMKLYPNLKKFYKAVKWRPKYSIEQGLQKTINYYKKNQT